MSYRYEVITKSKDIYLMADFVNITQNGDLVFLSNIKDAPGDQPVAVFAAGVWEEFYAASMIDGSQIAVDGIFSKQKK